MTAKIAKASTKKTKTVKSKAKSAEASTKLAAVVKKTDGKKSLGLWYLRLGIVLVALAVAIVIMGKSTTVPVTVHYLAKDVLATEAAKGQEVLAPAMRHLFDVRLSWLVAKFLVLLAASYLLVATVWRKKYESWLDRGINPMRWVGLGVGGGAALTTVVMLSGVSDVSELMLVFGSIVLAALLAGATEVIGRERMVRRFLCIGAVVAAFLPLLILVRTAGSVPLFNGALPIYLYFVYGAVALFAVLMGVATYLSNRKTGKWASVFYAERVFIGLGFLASVVVALLIFAGALQA